MNAPATLHGSVFAYQGVGCLLTGAAGTGKSTLVGEALLFGAKFVADDQIQLSLMNGILMAGPAPNIAGVLELPGYGLMRIHDYNQRQVIHLVAELGTGQKERLPAPQTIELLGIKVPLVKLPPVPQTTVGGLLLYMKAMQEGRMLPQDWMPKRAGA